MTFPLYFVYDNSYNFYICNKIRIARRMQITGIDMQENTVVELELPNPEFLLGIDHR